MVGCSSFPSILLINARSVLPKMDELHLLKSVHSPSIIAVSESWLHVGIDSSLLHIPGFALFRTDRNDRLGGGVCTWCNLSLSPQVVDFVGLPHVEICAVYLHKVDCLLIVVYLPPGMASALLSSSYSCIVDIVDTHLLAHPNSDVILCGDVNQYDTRVLESSLSLTNVVNAPTRLNNTLDKFFLSSDILHLYSEPILLPPLSTSDHNCVFLKPVKSSSTHSVTHHYVFDYRRSHLNLYLELLSKVNFSVIYLLSDINQKVMSFYNILKACVDTIPRTSVTMTSSDKPWITPLLKSLIDERWYAYRSKQFSRYNYLKMKVKKEIIRSKKEWITRSRNSKDWWDVVSEIRGTKSKCNLLPIISNFRSKFEAAEFLNNLFSSVFSSDPGPAFPSTVSAEHWASPIEVLDVYKCLTRLKSRSCGSDGIPNRLYREGAAFHFGRKLFHSVQILEF